MRREARPKTPHTVFFPAAQVPRRGPWDRRTPHVLPPADEMRGSGIHPPTAAFLPPPIHAKFSDPRKLRKALCERDFNSYTLKIHPHDLQMSQISCGIASVIRRS